MFRPSGLDRPLLIALLAIALALVLNAAMPYLVAGPSHQANNPTIIANNSEWGWGAAEAIATALIAIYAIRQYVESRRSSERQLRAYVLVEEARVESFGVGEHPKAIIRIKNFGQTPAYKLSQGANIGFLPFPPDREPPATKSDSDPESIIGPGGVQYLLPCLNTEVMTQRKLDDIGKGTHALYVVGEIHYEDCFGHPRCTKYFFFSGGGKVDLGALSAIGPFNEST